MSRMLIKDDERPYTRRMSLNDFSIRNDKGLINLYEQVDRMMTVFASAMAFSDDGKDES